MNFNKLVLNTIALTVCGLVFLAGYLVVSDIIREQSFLHELDSRGLAIGEKAVRQVIEQCRPYYKNDSYVYDDKDGNKQESGRCEYLTKMADERMISPGCYKREDNGVIFITHSVYYYTPGEIVCKILWGIDEELNSPPALPPGRYDQNADYGLTQAQLVFKYSGRPPDEKLIAEYKKNPDVQWAFEVYDALKELDCVCKKVRESGPIWKKYKVQEECLQKLSELEKKNRENFAEPSYNSSHR